MIPCGEHGARGPFVIEDDDGKVERDESYEMSDEAPSNVIRLVSARAKLDKPDEFATKKDDFGRPIFLFLLEYRMDGQDYGAEVWAYHWADAMERVKAMRKSLKVIGQAFTKLPA